MGTRMLEWTNHIEFFDMLPILLKSFQKVEKIGDEKLMPNLYLSWESPIPSLLRSIETMEVQINISMVQEIVSTIAGNKGHGFGDGNKETAKFHHPHGVATDKYNNVYVADYYNHRIRKISPSGEVTTIAGSGVIGYADGVGTNAMFHGPISVAIDDDDNLFISDFYNHKIRKISKQGAVSTIAGSSSGYQDGIGTHAKFSNPTQIVLDSEKNIFISEWNNDRIRKITPGGVVSTIAGTGVSGLSNGNASAAQFRNPSGIALDDQGSLYVADLSNHQIRKITTTGIVSTFAGSTPGYKDGVGSEAQFNGPRGITFDGDGNLLVVDRGNHKIRKVNPQGVVSTIAGTNQGHVDGPYTTASFYSPYDIALLSNGHMLVADNGNHAIRKLS